MFLMERLTWKKFGNELPSDWYEKLGQLAQSFGRTKGDQKWLNCVAFDALFRLPRREIVRRMRLLQEASMIDPIAFSTRNFEAITPPGQPASERDAAELGDAVSDALESLEKPKQPAKRRDSKSA